MVDLTEFEKEITEMRKQILKDSEKRFSDGLNNILSNAFELEKKRTSFIVAQIIIVIFFSITAFLAAVLGYRALMTWSAS